MFQGTASITSMCGAERTVNNETMEFIRGRHDCSGVVRGGYERGIWKKGLMMSDVKEAAERMRQHIAKKDEASGPYYAGTFYQMDNALILLSKDLGVLSRAYLAEHPADEHEAITEAWLRSVGFFERCEYLVIRPSEPMPIGLRHTKIGFGLIDGNWYANGLGCKTPETRGQLRLLARALGIPLKESERSVNRTPME